MERGQDLVTQKARQIMHKLSNVRDRNDDDGRSNNNSSSNNGVFGSEEEAEFYAVVKAGLREIAERLETSKVHCVERIFARNLALESLDKKVEMSLRAVSSEVEVDEGEVCAVCMEELAGGGRGVKAMPCSHVFHDECIKSWLRLESGCPLCRQPASIS